MTVTAPITFRCPRCGARPGQACANMPADSYHAPRWVMAHYAESEAERQRKFRIELELLEP